MICIKLFCERGYYQRTHIRYREESVGWNVILSFQKRTNELSNQITQFSFASLECGGKFCHCNPISYSYAHYKSS